MDYSSLLLRKKLTGQTNSVEFSHQQKIIFHVINPKRTSLCIFLLHIIRIYFMLDGHLIFIGMNTSEKYKSFLGIAHKTTSKYLASASNILGHCET